MRAFATVSLAAHGARHKLSALGLAAEDHAAVTAPSFVPVKIWQKG